MTTTQQLKDLLGRATPGPWSIKWEFNIFGPGERLTANCGGTSSNRGDGEYAMNIANTKLVAEAVNALPALLAVVEAAENVRAEWTSKHVIKTPLDRRMAELIAALAALNTEQKTNG